ncbi:hypothetical protein B0H14DRAFT_3435805 [Mycena olivaceomarginata]|nr:hypothetical protein B0H14DRAFT_3435805 [Mycena olivaceomarginata]
MKDEDKAEDADSRPSNPRRRSISATHIAPTPKDQPQPTRAYTNPSARAYSSQSLLCPIQSVTESQSDSEEVEPRGDSNEKRQNRVWKIEETSSQRQEDIDAGVPSDEQLLAMKLCGKRDESPRSIQWSTGVRGQGVTLVKQCIVASEQSWPDRSLGESRHVDIGGGQALWRCPESTGPDRLLRFLLAFHHHVVRLKTVSSTS